jgi:hypothetical protein
VRLRDQLVLAAEGTALRIQGFDGEGGAIADEGREHREGAGIEVQQADLDGVLRQGAALQDEDGSRGREQTLEHGISCGVMELEN